mmetsp:Transcript_4168/g.7091  ORF Transcript_4168/g.7091 Transcript_4168/m.7091 type:complete len:88 (-) Transcript_4168:328-591(-)|eukprot:CAMPEP_0198229528 /NCGR_PEP_ID=MMETSP1445-20131203/114171_1 /TAXON_ID=36898 /ORGANISM="Pyramimonas sp., Strain CCMP2087" /LENGTH=87 /DNA_ID=CAMNT_0043909991 /DNA_START=242 /DNA_END=505 /DNA_ORIENTATION=-
MGLVADLKTAILDKFDDKVEFTNEPVEVPGSEPKPYEIFVDDELVYSMLTGAGGSENKPIVFGPHKYFGEPVASKLEGVMKAIEAKV